MPKKVHFGLPLQGACKVFRKARGYATFQNNQEHRRQDPRLGESHSDA
jgi:hypothetical protein